MKFIFSYKRYKRPFKTPIITSRGEWHNREGILIRLINKKRKTAYGEIAPLDGFANETLEMAERFCQRLGKRVDLTDIDSIPNTLPCCQYAFGCVKDELVNERLDLVVRMPVFKLSRLLPRDPIPILKEYIKEGSQSFKLKIGISATNEEIKKVEEICSYFPKGTFLRLDANGSLSFKQAERWLKVIDQLSVEALEQPLRADAIKPMMELSKKYRTPIVLDESVTNCKQLTAVEKIGWRGPVAIKPLVVGSRERFLTWRKQTNMPLIYSSAFETSIGLESVLRLAASDNDNINNPVGFDTQKFFGDDIFNLHANGPNIQPLDNALEKFGKLWEQL